MRLRKLGAALCVGVLGIFALAPGSKERVVQIEVLIKGNDVSILSWRDATQWTEEALPRQPRITRSTWQKIDHDQSELLIALHDKKGKAFRNVAYPGRYVSFLETLASYDRGESTLKGGFATPSSNVRMLFLPFPDKTEFISFYRSEIRREPLTLDHEDLNQERFHVSTIERKTESNRSGSANEAVSFGWNMLGNFPAPRPPGDDPPKPIELLDIPKALKFAKFPKDLPPALLTKRSTGGASVKKASMDFPCTGEGEVTGHVLLHAATAPPIPGKRPYNIVIFGDGFIESEADISGYRMLADKAADAFENTAPYSTFFENVNLWRIDTACLTSGIANCPDMPCPDTPAPAETYYRISGCMQPIGEIQECDELYAGYLGPEALCPLEVAAEQELPGVYVDLRLVIANCDIYGGAAYPDDRLVVIPAFSSVADFQELVLHEAAHVIGRVCDEYWVCVKWEGEWFPNFATLAQVNSGTVPWKGLDPTWALHKHVRGQPPCSVSGTDHNYDYCLGAAATAPASLRGAFWGCQFFDPSYVPSECCSLDCTDWQVGSIYFRPSPQCKMKELFQPFCFACSEAVGDRLRSPPIVLLP